MTSDLPGHDHDPDPAALDELRRAFSGGVDEPEPHGRVRPDDRPAGSDDDHGDDRNRDGADDQHRNRVEDRDDDHVADRNDDLGADRHGGETDVDDDHDPSGLITEPTPVQRPAPGRTAPSESGRVVTLADLGSGSGASEDPEPTPPSLADPVPHDEQPEHDEHVERDATPELEAPERLVVIEPPPAERPARIIRIDDYSGSAEIAPADTAPVVDPGLSPAPDVVPGAATDIEPADGDVISISGDDLPDPVYVEGNLDRGGGTIVFIENDETGDTLAPESERDMRRGIEPRMRERRVAVKRAQGRRRLKRALVVVGVIALVVGVLAVLGSSLFAVQAENVEVFGVGYAQGERLDEILDDAIGTPVLRLDTTRIEEDLEAIPWVDEAEVRADFPHGLVIDVRERAAVSTYQGPDGMYRVLDREGRVLDVIENGYPYAYVLLGGPDAVDLEPGEFAPQGYAAASELARNLTSSLRGHVVRMEVLADGSRLVLELDDGSTVYFGEARDLLAKLVRLEAVLGNNQECPPGLIDVSTADTTRPQECSTSS